MTSFENLIQRASIPELKEALRQFQTRCPQSHELVQCLSGTLELEERNSKEGLRQVVEGVCENFEECRDVISELLGCDEDEFPRRSWILDSNSEGEGSPELKYIRRKGKKMGKRKRGLLSSPPIPAKQKKIKNSPGHDETALLPSKVPTWWPDLNAVQNKTKILKSSPAASQKRKRTIAEIFEADRQRRELEAQQDAERRRQEIEVQAKCARCKAFFLTDDNWKNSCAFHPGSTRHYHPASKKWNGRWFCCGREWGDQGCMEAKHIDNRLLEMVGQWNALQVSACEEARTVVYRSCEECETDVEAEFDFEDEGEDSETREDDSDLEDDEQTSLEEELSALDKSIPVCDGEIRRCGEEIVLPDDVSLTPETVEEESTAGNDEVVSVNDEVSAQEKEILISDEDVRLPEKDLEPDDISNGPDIHSPRENVPPSSQRFLCHSCEEEAAAKTLNCTICYDEFKALPSHDAYNADEPICGKCFWANSSGNDRCCTECGVWFEGPMRPHWYKDDCDDDEDELCLACTRRMEEEDEVEAQRFVEPC